MRIKMKTTACGPNGNYIAGIKYTVDSGVGKGLIEAGAAEAVKETGHETTMVDVPDNAMVDTLTRKEIMAALDLQGVEYSKRSNKAELLKLLK